MKNSTIDKEKAWLGCIRDENRLRQCQITPDLDRLAKTIVINSNRPKAFYVTRLLVFTYWVPKDLGILSSKILIMQKPSILRTMWTVEVIFEAQPFWAATNEPQLIIPRAATLSS